MATPGSDSEILDTLDHSGAVHRAVRRRADDFGWLDRAQCRDADVDLFFPVGESGSGWKESEAKSMCTSCPVLAPCREWALKVAPEFGIFGGLTAEERRHLGAVRRRPVKARPSS